MTLATGVVESRSLPTVCGRVGSSTLTVAVAILCAGMLGGCVSDGPDAVMPWPRFVQPDYARWAMVLPGMTEAQVEQLVGPALERDSSVPEWATVFSATYGTLQFDPARCPTPYQFRVSYSTRSGRLLEKFDPFDGRFSMDGRPTVPHPIYPVAGQQFDHFPRHVDFRWTPSSGTYPITYEIQLKSMPDDDWDGPSVYTRTVDAPYYLDSWVGKNVCTWRVRGRNAMGFGPWSQERRFDFNR